MNVLLSSRQVLVEGEMGASLNTQKETTSHHHTLLRHRRDIAQTPQDQPKEKGIVKQPRERECVEIATAQIIMDSSMAEL
jgi:hypothetical protein